MMEHLWQHLLQALAQLSPKLVQSLRPGVSEQALQEAEQRFGFAFPGELRAYFRLHNGSLGPLFGTWSLLSLEEVCQAWYTLKQRAKEDQQRYQSTLQLQQKLPFSLTNSQDPIPVPLLWHKTWLPLFQSGSYYGEYRWLVLDAALPISEDDPIPENTEEVQRLFYYPSIFDYDSLTCPTTATSIIQVFQRLIGALEAGVYLYEPQMQGLTTLTFTSPLARLYEPPLHEVYQQHPELLPLFKERLLYSSLCCTSSFILTSEQVHTLQKQTIEQSWTLLRTTLRTLAPPLEADLYPAASERELEQCEVILGRQLPEDVRIWYSLCNGASAFGDTLCKGLFDLWSWYTLEAIVQRWQWQREYSEYCGGEMQPLSEYPVLDARIQAVNFHPAWIPFMAHEDESLLCIDLAPTASGTYGQIILLHYPSIVFSDLCSVMPLPPLVCIAPSLRVFLATIAQDMSVGKYRWSPSERMLWSKAGFSYMTENENMRYPLCLYRRQLLYPDQQEPSSDIEVREAYYRKMVSGELPREDDVRFFTVEDDEFR